MIKPAKFVINDSGIAAYDENGGVLSQTPHSTTYIGSMNELEGNVFGKMEEMPQERKDELIAEGLNVLSPSLEEVVVKGTHRSFTYNYANKTQTLTRFDDNGVAISTISTVYLPVTSVDPNHSDITDVLPFFIKEIRKVNLPSGACAEFVRTTHREDYSIINGSEVVERSENEDLKETINWYPNPVKDILTIENALNEILTVRIYNLAISLQNNELSLHINNAMDQEESEDFSDNYIIAHSQGGLVSRAIDRLYTHNTAYGEEERLFGGIVTFGTSHGGAYILNSQMDGAIDDFSSAACNALGAGPALELYQGNWFTSLIGVDQTVDGYIEEAVGEACDVASSILIPQFFSDFSASITDDYFVGADYLEGLNSDIAEIPIPAVAFHGKEDNPVIWRTLSSLRSSINGFDPFTADDDQGLVDDVAANILEYEMKYLAYDNLALEIEISTCSWWQWILFAGVCLHTEASAALFNSIQDNHNETALLRATAFYNGWQWWLNADEQWKTLIGAITFEEVTTNQCHCLDPNSIEEFTVNFSESECNDVTGYFCQFSIATSYIRHEEGSDGIVPISSAIAYPGAATGDDKELTGSNHQQMRNDSKLKTKLTELYAGDHGFYFYVDKRP
jgi:hypothetical protein